MRPAETGKYAANVFTPNVIKGNGNIRHLLYRRGDQCFAIDPDGRQFFWARVEADNCGLGCKCGAFITPYSQKGDRLLAQSKRIDNSGNLVDAVTPKVAETSHVYTPAELELEARQLSKGLGYFLGWELEFMDLDTGHVRLVSKFIRNFNPLRPTAQQAIERVTMVL